MQTLTIRQLGAGLGMSHQAAAKHVRNGMPRTSIQAAQEWHRANVGGPGRRFARVDATPATPPPQPLAAAPAPPQAPPAQVQQPAALAEADRALAVAEAPVDLETETAACREALQDARRMRKFAMASALRAHQAGQADAARRWTQVHQSGLARQAIIEGQFRTILERDRVTISYAVAVAEFRQVLQDVRVLCAGMPAQLAAKCNPQDPAHAQAMLAEWRDNTLFRTLYEAENRT